MTGTGWAAEFRLLGSVEVLRDGQPAGQFAAQPRCVLAVLLLADGAVVSVDRLIDALWGEHAPGEPRNAIQVYVSRLRRMLAGASGVEIETAGRHGYRMTAPDDAVDLRRFRRLVAEARDADGQRALDLLTTALGLWHGEPFGGAAGDWLHRQVTPGLEDEHLQALEARAHGYGQLGRHGEAIGELSTLYAEHPTREQLAAALMSALHRDGRTAEALAVFRDLRTRLVDELGIEPGEPVRRLHESILSGEAAEEEPDGPVVPAQLPGDVALFVGRTDLVDPAVAHLAEPGTAPRVVAVTGPGGTGKSALAVHIGQKVRDEFPDGQLFAALGGQHEADVLADFLLALGVAAARIPAAVEARAALFRSMVARARVLVVLDDARDAAQVRPLLPGTASCAVIVTSRSRLAALAATHRVSVEGLSVAESVELLSSVLGPDRVAAEPAAAEELARWCGYLPLALRVSAARLTNRPQWPIRSLADRLSDERARLDELQLGDLDVRASFTLSYQQLAADAARAFRTWSLAPSRWLTDSAAAAMLGTPRRQADAVADALIDLHLLDVVEGERLRLHDLLRQLGRDLAETTDGAAAGDDALGRLTGWYAHSFAAALAAVVPGIRPARYLLPGAEDALTFSGADTALSWLDTERANLAAVVLDAAERTLIPPADLVWIAANFGRYAGPRGYLDEWRRLCSAAVVAAQRFGDQRSEARARIALGAVAYRSSELDTAADHLGWAANQLANTGEATEATAMGNLAMVYDSLQRRTEVIDHLNRALEIYQRIGDRRGQASALANLGRQHAELGDHDEAIRVFRTALDLTDAIGATDVRADAHNGLADALALAGQPVDARQHYRTALDLVAGSHNLAVSASALAGLARLSEGRTAVDHYERAITAYREGHFDFELALTLVDLGVLLRAGQPERAGACWREAESVAGRLADAQADQVRARLAVTSGG
jgi:DNA-binding SARP family transcriptional activator/tetratricopeptide (TPR) repeat protein